MAGRNPKVCTVCLGNADTTDDKCKCNGKFGDAKCNDWLWGWFVVDDTVTRASKSSKVANDSASHNTDLVQLLCKVHQYIMNSPLQRDYVVSDYHKPMEKIAQQH